MIRRSEGSGFLTIRQIDHAHLALDLVAALDPRRVRLPSPRAAFLEAVRRHDDGWLEEDRRPRLDVGRRRPYHFSEVPIARHLAIWRRGIGRAAARRPYVALLMSLHVIGLYDDFFVPEERTADERRRVARFYDQQGRAQRSLVRRLGRRRAFHRAVDGDALLLARRWLRIADGLSLVLCCGPVTRASFVRPDRCVESLRFVPRGEREFTLEPWPFRRRTVTFAVRAHEYPSGRPTVLRFRAVDAR